MILIKNFSFVISNNIEVNIHNAEYLSEDITQIGGVFCDWNINKTFKFLIKIVKQFQSQNYTVMADVEDRPLLIKVYTKTEMMDKDRIFTQIFKN